MYIPRYSYYDGHTPVNLRFLYRHRVKYIMEYIRLSIKLPITRFVNIIQEIWV